MRIRKAGTKGIGIGPVDFDGWDVLVGGGIACIVVASTVAGAPPFLLYLGISLIVVWLVATVIVNVRAGRQPSPDQTSGGGTAPGSAKGRTDSR